MKKNFRIIKSSENNLIMFLKEGKNLDILKIAQRGNASLQREYETILKLKKFSKVIIFFFQKFIQIKKLKVFFLKINFIFFKNFNPA